MTKELQNYIASNEATWPRELRQKAQNALCVSQIMNRPDNQNEICERLNKAILQEFLDAIR